jgi:hypothetical protein
MAGVATADRGQTRGRRRGAKQGPAIARALGVEDVVRPERRIPAVIPGHLWISNPLRADVHMALPSTHGAAGSCCSRVSTWAGSTATHGSGTRGAGAGSVRSSLRRSTITRWRSTAHDARSSRSAGRTTASRSRTARCVSRMTRGRRPHPKAHLRGSTPGWFTTLVSSASSYTADVVQATRPSAISGSGTERGGPQSPVSRPSTDDR